MQVQVCTETPNLEFYQTRNTAANTVRMMVSLARLQLALDTVDGADGDCSADPDPDPEPVEKF